MNEQQFREVFTRFLNGYWGAFHELLEAESVNRDRLAGSLLANVIDQHRQFAAICPAETRMAVDGLGRLWREVNDHRVNVPDDPLTAEQVVRARSRFEAIYDRLFDLGRRFPAARAAVLQSAAHAVPGAPLRADAAS
jgi:hypothetical protein